MYRLNNRRIEKPLPLLGQKKKSAAAEVVHI